MKVSKIDAEDTIKVSEDVSSLAVAAWRSQAFWGLLVWVDEKLISTSLKMRHYYALAALVDREVRYAAGVPLDKMTSARLTTSMRKEFHGEYDQSDPELSQKQAENDLAFMRSKDDASRALIYNDEGGIGWRPTERGTRIFHDIADDLGRLALTQAKLLETLAPERTDKVTEADGFYNRAKKLLKGLKPGRALLARISVVVAVVATISLFEGFGSLTYDTAKGQAESPVGIHIEQAAGPRDFGDGTLTRPLMVCELPPEVPSV